MGLDLDETNTRILELLQEDGRRSYRDMAEHMDRAESTVRDRVEALEEMGAIERYTAVLDARRLGLTGRALVRARVPADQLSSACEKLLSVPEVTNLHHATGERNLGLVVTAADVGSLRDVVEDVSSRANLERMNTDVVLRTVTRSRPAPLKTLLDREPLVEEGWG